VGLGGGGAREPIFKVSYSKYVKELFLKHPFLHHFFYNKVYRIKNVSPLSVAYV